LIEYVEDLMDGQAAFGYDVAYFFSGRQYPLFRHPRLRRWRRGPVQFFELVDSPIAHGGDRGSELPELDLQEPRTEALFRRVLRSFRPDIVHFQELAGLPSSLIPIVRDEAQVPTVMTLQDYFPLCPTMKLFDSRHELCIRRDVGESCGACCSGAPRNREILIDSTIRYEIERLKDRVPASIKLALKRRFWRLRTDQHKDQTVTSELQYSVNTTSARLFQRRREVNLERLKRIDLLIAQSRRVGEIFRVLGATNGNIRTIQLTLRHLAEVKPCILDRVAYPIHFTTLNGCYTEQKGSRLLLAALQILNAAGLAEKFRLFAWGGLSDQAREEFGQAKNLVHGGWYKVADLNRVLDGTHVGIIPSVWEEAFGFVGLEFLAKCVPIIGNARGGIVDYTIEGVTGWVNHDNTAEGLARIMAQIIQDPEQIVRLNQSICARYCDVIKSMDQHVKEMDSVYRELAAGRSPA
jgi:glycosyltransferase involved in cell wall biosynthesis